MNNAQAVSTPLALSDLHLPAEPSFWPLAWGWWGGALVIILLLIGLLVFLKMRKKKLAPKVAALTIFERERTTLSPSAAIELLRQTALCYYPRAHIAHLSGQAWLEFLDSQLKSPLFVQHLSTWQYALYHKKPSKKREAHGKEHSVQHHTINSLPSLYQQERASIEAALSLKSSSHSNVDIILEPENTLSEQQHQYESIRQQLVDHCHQWIEKALPPTRRYRE